MNMALTTCARQGVLRAIARLAGVDASCASLVSTSSATLSFHVRAPEDSSTQLVMWTVGNSTDLVSIVQAYVRQETSACGETSPVFTSFVAGNIEIVTVTAPRIDEQEEVTEVIEVVVIVVMLLASIKFVSAALALAAGMGARIDGTYVDQYGKETVVKSHMRMDVGAAFCGMPSRNLSVK